MKKLTGLLLVTVMAGAILAALALPAFAATSNTGGVVVESGDAPDCVGGSCGGVIVEDPAGAGPDCTGGNCGGSVCQGTDCGSCAGGNCGGSISGPGTEADHGKKHEYATPAKAAHGAKALPRTGIPTAATLALGAGMILVGLFFTFVEHPSTKVAMAAMTYRPRRRL
ncbi:MAG TPA: hypothetical protein VHI31_03360 [Actinomycetota bacterium]|nr:hypothetical protein [Actinomycetota bacterium]